MSNNRRTKSFIIDSETYVPLGALDDSYWTIYLLSKQVGLENIIFRSNPLTKCSGREVESIKKIPSDSPHKNKYEVLLNKGGLDHVTGLLPPWLTEIMAGNYIEERKGSFQNIEAINDFFNIFSHYIVGIMYKIFLKNQPALIYQSGGKDQISNMLFSFLGFSEKRVSNNATLLSYIDILGHHHSRSTQGLQHILDDYFAGTKVRVKEFIPRKVRIPKEDRMYFGKKEMRLGGNHVFGKWINDVSGSFRIVVGPLEYHIFQEFLPGKEKFKCLMNLIKIYAPPHLVWDLILKVKCESLPKMYLGSGRFGQDVWFNLKKNNVQNSLNNKRDFDIVINPLL